MKPTFVFLLAVLVTAAFGKDEPVAIGRIELHGDHAVLIRSSQSADGRYAIGWTVHPKKGQPPVKWEDYDKEGGTFREDYVLNDGYLVTDVIVDLEHRAIAIALPFSDPYFDGKNHGGLQGVFGPERDGHRFAIVMSEGKWNPYDAALVDLSAEGASAVDVLKLLNAGVDKFIAGQGNGKKRYDPEDFATDYRISELPETGLLTGFSDAQTVRIPFSSEIPKGLESPGFTGTLQLRLTREKDKPHAEVGEVREYKEDPEPAQDDPRVAAADKELNAAYTAARNARNATGKAALLDEQRAWIKDRDAQVAALRAKVFEDATIANPRFAADRLLLQLTQERAAVLRGK